jgi:NADPH-dependent 2,4-dienoyl-CoA reductase/sulfur reductase-like enzyme
MIGPQRTRAQADRPRGGVHAGGATGARVDPFHVASPMHIHVAIVGSGFSGLGAAIRLKQEGTSDFVILERAADVGGTWRDNS